MSWKDKDCSDCTFRDMDECRRFPPMHRNGFPTVEDHGQYSEACAEHATELQQLTIKDVVR